MPFGISQNTLNLLGPSYKLIPRLDRFQGSYSRTGGNHLQKTCINLLSMIKTNINLLMDLGLRERINLGNSFILDSDQSKISVGNSFKFCCIVIGIGRKSAIISTIVSGVVYRWNSSRTRQRFTIEPQQFRVGNRKPDRRHRHTSQPEGR